MPEIVTGTAQVKCTGAMPPGLAVLNVLPINMVSSGTQPVATVMDNKPFVNIVTFGACTMMPKPPPQLPCVFAPAGPWSPGSSKLSIKGQKALTKSCKLNCAIGGQISIVSPGVSKIKAP
jgi:hypothetical protein